MRRTFAGTGFGLDRVGGVISQSEALTLPHPRAAQRDFVLQPIVEIWPDYRLPGFEASASELLAQLGSSPLQYWDAPTIERWIDRWASTAF